MKTSLLLATATCCLPGLARAQETRAAETRPGEQAVDPQDIVVTASRRSERLQDTALAISAVSADRLDAAGLTDTASLQRAVPSLQFATTAGSSFVYLRGVGSDVFGSFSDNSIATYIDGIYIPKQTTAIQELFDVDRVEVLRGPQATLYGRNATGGAILITTAQPSSTLVASGDAEVGNLGRQRYRAVLSGPLAGDALRARVSVVRSRNDGYSLNLADGSRFDDQDYWGVRGTLAARPLDDLTITLTGTYTREDGAPGASKAVDRNSFPFAPFPFGAGTPFSADPRASYHSLRNSAPSETYGANLRVEWKLGFADLTSNSAYNRYKLGPSFGDLDDSLAPLLEYRGQVQDTDFYYQDLTLASRKGDGPFGWLIGGTYAREETDGTLPTLTPGGLSLNVTGTTVDAYAAYAQLDYALTQRLKLVGGLRYSSETRSGTALPSFNGGPAFPLAKRKTWDDVSPKASIEYRPASGTLIYASATKGFKSGSFDPINITNVAEPESIWSYEAGLKSELLDRRVTLNLTGFYYDYKNLQIFNGVINGNQVVPFLQNACCATIKGLEIEPSVRVTRGFTVGASVTLLDARYGSDVLADTANARPAPPGGTAVVPLRNIGGNRMVQAPRLTATIFASWRIDLGRRGGSLELYADYFHQSKRFFTAFEDQTLSARAYDVVNLKAAYHLPGDHLYIGAFVRNAGDTLIRSSISRTPPFGTLETYAPPRLYGVQAGFRF